jgi:hypothetical protein
MALRRSDQPRLDHLAAKAAEYRAQASLASDPKRRRRHERSAKTFERSLRMERAFPIQVYLWGTAGVVVLLPWSLLAHAHHVVAGLVCSGVALIVLVLVKVRRRPGTRFRR